MRQAVDRDHQNVVLDALDAPRTDKAHDGECAVAGPSSPAPRQPRRLLAHPSEMTSVVCPGLRLDRYRDPVRGDRHRVDVSPTLPRQRMPQPPALRLQRCQRALDGVLRAGPDPAPASEREPVARAQAERSGDDEQAHGDETPHSRWRPTGQGARRRPPRSPLRRRARAGGTAGAAHSSPGVPGRSQVLQLRACASCGVQQPLRLLAGRQKHRLADRLAGRRALPPVALPNPARQPFPVPPTPRTLRAPLLAHDLYLSPRGRHADGLGAICDRSAGHHAAAALGDHQRYVERWRVSGSCHPGATTPSSELGPRRDVTRSRSPNTSGHGAMRNSIAPAIVSPGRDPADYDDDALDRLADRSRIDSLCDLPASRPPTPSPSRSWTQPRSRDCTARPGRGSTSTPANSAPCVLARALDPDSRSHPRAWPSSSKQSTSQRPRPCPSPLRRGADASVPIARRQGRRCCMCGPTRLRSTPGGPRRTPVRPAALPRTPDTRAEAAR